MRKRHRLRKAAAKKRSALDASVKHPADHSAAGGATGSGHQGPEASSRHSVETRIDVRFEDQASAQAQTQPDPAPIEGQRRTRLKAHSLIDKVYRWDNLYKAWRRVRANKGAHGLDRVTIHAFEADLDTHLREIQRKLMEHRYVPQPVRRVYIPKASDPKQRRPLGIPTVADRIVGQAILQIVDPLFDSQMSNRSYGFRKERNAHQAIATILKDVKEGFRVVLDADITSFFDQLDHQVVMSRVRDRIADGRVLDLIEAFLKAGVSEDGMVTVPSVGSPQGGVISPWLANLVLDDLDKAIESKGWRHVRYADDFVILCKSQIEAENALAFVEKVLADLKLSLHKTKTRTVRFEEGFEFLGFHFRWWRLGIRSKAIERFKEQVRKLTRRQQGRNVEAVIKDLNAVLRGYARYFGVAEVGALFARLDAWIRMRIRSFKTKRRSRHDNHRYLNRRLAKWGLLSLLECRPELRFFYMGVAGP